MAMADMTVRAFMSSSPHRPNFCGALDGRAMDHEQTRASAGLIIA